MSEIKTNDPSILDALKSIYFDSVNPLKDKILSINQNSKIPPDAVFVVVAKDGKSISVTVDELMDAYCDAVVKGYGKELVETAINAPELLRKFA